MTSQAEFWPGKSFGVPAAGPGAIAGLGQRILAFAIDILLAALITWIFTAPDPPLNWSLIAWGLISAIGVGLLGQTPGDLLVGIRVATLRPADRSQLVGLLAVPRTVLVGLLVPPLILDKDGRGLHDRLCYTVVVRTR